jgi:hypothetical protein
MLLALVAALAVVVAGCARSGDDRRSASAIASPPIAGCEETGLVTESDDPGGGPPGPSIRWDDPVGGHGRAVASIEEAATMLTFSPLLPETLRPCAVIVSAFRPRYLVLRFQHPELGVFHVSEHALQRPVRAAERGLRGRAGPCAHQGCEGRWSLVKLEGGREALLVTGEKTALATHNIEFIDAERAIDVVIQGPPHTFDAKTALTVANDFP